MIQVIRDTTQKASKQYHDSGYEWIMEYIGNKCYEWDPKPSFADYRILVWVKNNRIEASKIFPGQEYSCQFNKWDGQTYTFRTKKEFQRLCVKYKMYPDDL